MGREDGEGGCSKSLGQQQMLTLVVVPGWALDMGGVALASVPTSK